MPSPRVRSAASFLSHHHHQHHQRQCPNASTANKKFFSTTLGLYAASCEPTLYEILDVPVTASAAEIKKQFYSLSLRHHPDRNRTDPAASSRFARISSAYQTLGNAAKRTSYDRDHGIHTSPSSTYSTANPGQHPMGSYSSHSANVNSKGASYAGSRPASGLSKRRGPFRGPPPSFYAHGGYGNQAGRRAPHGGAAGWASSSYAGTGAAEEDPLAFLHRNPIYHFNARGHYKTQSAEDARRQERRSKAMGAELNEQHIGKPGDFAFRFLVVFGILMGAGAMTGVLWKPKDQKNPKKAAMI
ncbi:DnaJ domain protein [Aspergillus ruber CBS 135680]|uniref:DnaJ domain protein n=1 Tax=Aspergillus ruber (strain CBS 135680) TaxID=1388766 RepID=A0A017SM79_ASPRC|nr:DnaJ domain protein [Aspergillus ruber CBS 135680]EYE97896.1 DnaJ domain protein [Aspergillus ruber CBS 135680]